MDRDPETIWVVGGGKFGRISAEAMVRRRPGCRVLVVDAEAEAWRRMAALGFQTVCGDGVDFLDERLDGPDRPRWIIPVVPVHLACEWLRRRLARRRRVAALPVPPAVVERLPNPVGGLGGGVFVSIADFVCPENCPEPPGICTRTEKKRPYLLFEELRRIEHDGKPCVVVRSRQLAPGVGGFPPEALFSALEAAEATEGPLLVATACSCHGVLHALDLDPPA